MMSFPFRSTLCICIIVGSLMACQPNASHEDAYGVMDSAGKIAVTDTQKHTQGTRAAATQSNDVNVYVLPGYTILDTASGDLNLDNYPDEIVILKKNGEDSTSDVVDHPEKRPLLLLTDTPDGKYILAARSDNSVYCVDCGGMLGDPFTGVTIKKGYFSVEHYGGSGERWTRIITFKYSPADRQWYLYKDGGDSFYASDPEKATTEVRTEKDFGKVNLVEFDIYKEE